MPYTIEPCFPVAERAAALGFHIPDGFAILPTNLEVVSNAEQFLYNSADATVRTLFRLHQIPLVDLLPSGASRRQLSHKSADWVGPIIFIGSAVLSDNGILLNLALGIVSNYLTDYFRGSGKTPTIKLEFIVEKTPNRDYRRLKFEGPPEAIPALSEALGALRDE